MVGYTVPVVRGRARVLAVPGAAPQGRWQPVDDAGPRHADETDGRRFDGARRRRQRFRSSPVCSACRGAAEDVEALEPEAFRRGLARCLRAVVLATSRGVTPLVDGGRGRALGRYVSAGAGGELAPSPAWTRPIVLLLIGAARWSDRARGDPQAVPRSDSPRAARCAWRSRALERRRSSRADPSPGPAAWVVERTPGNPFFVEEDVRALLRARRRWSEGNGGWELRTRWDERRKYHRPSRAWLASRIDTIPTGGATRNPRHCRRSSGARARGAARGGGSTADTCSARARHAGRGVPGGEPTTGRGATVAFHHALMQDVAYSRLLRRQRRELHRRIAEVAEEIFGSGDDVDRAARPASVSRRGGPKAVEYLVRAGERAPRPLRQRGGDRPLPARRRARTRAHRVAARASPTSTSSSVSTTARSMGTVRSATAALQRSKPGRGWRRHCASAAPTTRRSKSWKTHSARAISQLGICRRFGSNRGGRSRSQDASTRPSTRWRPVLDQRPSRPRGCPASILLQLARAETVEGHLERALAHATEAEAIFAQSDDKRGLGTTMRLLGDLHRYRGELDEAARVLRNGFDLSG